ncbi:MAG: universal stress protein [Planctomycetes bacterium]|nr:universal stress protein [Planctomycetota bacterium]
MQAPRVLVPLDGSTLAEAILPVVKDLAPAEVVLLRVARPGEGPEPRAYLEGIAGRVGEWANARTVIGDGRPPDAILAVASAGGVDLVALTTAGRSGFDRLVMGSVAEKVIRASALPVLALRAQDDTPAPRGGLFERVLMPCDGSVRAWRAAETLALLRAGRPADVTLFGVVDAAEAPPPELRAHVIEELLERERRALREELERASVRARDLGFSARAEVAIGPVAERIVARAESMGASLVAMATHGRDGLVRWALGSVTELVLRASTAPLLISR